jgi:hypothetical protein
MSLCTGAPPATKAAPPPSREVTKATPFNRKNPMIV